MRSDTLALIAGSGAYVLILQGAPIVFLGPTEFGYYSIIQLLVVLGSSLSLALVSETDSRKRSRGQTPSDIGLYRMVATCLALSFGVLAIAICLSIPALRTVVGWAAAAISASLYRNALVYRLTQDERLKRATGAHVVGALSLLTAILIVCSYRGSNWHLNDAMKVLFTASVMPLMVLPRPLVVRPRHIKEWFRSHRAEIASLLPDTALQDIGAFWAPNAIAVVLDVASLGIFRAVGATAAPVRFIVSPIRPMIARSSHVSATSRNRVLILTLLGGILGLTIWSGIRVAELLDLTPGTIASLVPYAWPVAIFVFGNLIGQYFSIVSRMYLRTNALLIGRVLQAFVLGVCPVLGALVHGLSSALWILSIGNVASGYAWYFLLVTKRALLSDISTED